MCTFPHDIYVERKDHGKFQIVKFFKYNLQNKIYVYIYKKQYLIILQLHTMLSVAEYPHILEYAFNLLINAQAIPTILKVFAFIVVF